MSTVTYPHIELTANGEPVLADSQTKVLEIALDRLAHHWDADEMKRQHPHLELGQIHAALAYYYDHQVELDERIAEQLREIHELRERLGPSPLVARLKALGRLP